MIQISGGSFPENSVGVVDAEGFKIIAPDGGRTVYPRIEKLDLISAEPKTAWRRKMMWGIGLGILTAGLGLIAILLVGNDREIRFFAGFSDGKKVTGIADMKGFGLLRTISENHDFDPTDPPTVQDMQRLQP